MAMMFIALTIANSAVSGFQVLYAFLAEFVLCVLGILYVSIRQFRRTQTGAPFLSGTPGENSTTGTYEAPESADNEFGGGGGGGGP